MLSISRQVLPLVVLLSAFQLPLHAQSTIPELGATQFLGPGPPEETDPTRNRAFGAAMSVNGRVALVSMPAFANDTGRVAVFTKEPTSAAAEHDAGRLLGKPNPPSWVRTGTLDPSDPLPGDAFGRRVALGEKLALIGALSGTYVFRRVNGNWIQMQKLQGVSRALAIEDDVAFVGGPESVFVFRRDKRGMLRIAQTLTTEEGIPAVGFGASLAVSSDTLVVSAPDDDEGKGAVYVFKKHGTNWVKVQKLEAIDGQSGDGFGSSVAIDDRLIAIGAPSRFEDSRPNCPEAEGLVYVFAPSHGLWFQRQQVEGPCFLFGFGSGVVIDNRTLVTSQPGTRSTQDAQAFIYEQLGNEFALAATTGGDLGNGGVIELALSRSTLFVGYPFDRQDINPNISVGHALIFDLPHCKSFDTDGSAGPSSTRSEQLDAARIRCPR